MKYILTLCTIFSFSGITIAQVEYKRDSIHQFSWNTATADWRFNTREFYTYDNGGDKETNLLRLNLSGSSWVNFYQFNKTYNSDNNLSENIRQNWNGSSWDNSERFNYEYDPLQNETQYLRSIFISGAWQEFQREQKVYVDTNLSEKLEEQYSFGSMVFEPQDRYFYTYTGSRLEAERKQFYLDDLSVWVNEQNLVYTYNAAVGGLLIDLSRYGWNANDDAFSTTATPKVLFTYNADNLVEERLTQLFSSAIDDYRNTERIVYTYVGGNQTELLLQDWNTTTDTWINNNRQLRTFDTNNNEIELIFENWDTASASWVGFLRIISYWSEVETLSVNSPSSLEQDVQLYPNPSSDYVTINSNMEIDHSKLYNINGQYIQTFNNTRSVDVTTLESGIYFLKITSENKTTTKKLIVK